jgi:hypothetical protein
MAGAMSAWAQNRLVREHRRRATCQVALDLRPRRVVLGEGPRRRRQARVPALTAVRRAARDDARGRLRPAGELQVPGQGRAPGVGPVVHAALDRRGVSGSCRWRGSTGAGREPRRRPSTAVVPLRVSTRCAWGVRNACAGSSLRSRLGKKSRLEPVGALPYCGRDMVWSSPSKSRNDSARPLRKSQVTPLALTVTWRYLPSHSGSGSIQSTCPPWRARSARSRSCDTPRVQFF